MSAARVSEYKHVPTYLPTNYYYDQTHQRMRDDVEQKFICSWHVPRCSLVTALYRGRSHHCNTRGKAILDLYRDRSHHIATPEIKQFWLWPSAFVKNKVLLLPRKQTKQVHTLLIPSSVQKHARLERLSLYSIIKSSIAHGLSSFDRLYVIL